MTNSIPELSLTELLAHPLLLLILSAIISRYLIPTLTRRWQDHEKELEIKIDLTGQISEEVTRMIMAVQLAEVGTKSQTQEDFDKAYQNFEVNSAVMGSRLRAYFPQTCIGPDWDKYSELVIHFYALTGTRAPARREERLQKISQYFSPNHSNIDWAALAKRERDYNYHYNWNALRNQILDHKNGVIQQILNSRISAF